MGCLVSRAHKTWFRSDIAIYGFLYLALSRYPTRNRHPTKYLTLPRAVSVEFHSDTTKRGIETKTYLFWSKKVKLFFFFFFSLFSAHFLAVIVNGTFHRFHTVPRTISTKCGPMCQKSYLRTLFLAGNCMISHVFKKLN